jgi:O-antigen/teichoic acid export membrane protein
MRHTISRLGLLLVGKEQSAVLRDRLLSGLGGLLGLRVAFSGLSFAGMVLLARLLGPEALGAYSYALAWVVLLAIPSLVGADQLLVREVAANFAQQQWGVLSGLLKTANRAVLLISLTVALLAGALAWLLSNSAGAGLPWTFWTALPFLPLITMTRVRQAVMQGLHRVTLGAAPEQVIQPGLLLAFLTGAWLLHHRLSAPIAMNANVAAGAVAFGAGAWLLSRTLPREVKPAIPEYRNLKWFQSALPLVFLAGIAALFAQADTLILGSVKGASAVGIYSVAHKGADLVAVMLNAQISAFASTVAGLYALGDREQLQRLVTRFARLTMLVSAPLGIGLIIFARWFLLLYGPSFVAGQTTLVILSLGQLGNIGMGFVGLLLIMTGHERQVAFAIGAGAAVNVILSFALAPRWGAEGVAVAYSVSMIVWNIWAAVVLYRKTGIHSTALGNLSWARVRGAVN